MKYLLIVLCFFSFLLYLKAEVFSLFPFHGSASETSGHFISNTLEGIDLAPESLKINGTDLKLKMRLVSTPLDECADILVKNFKGLNFFVSENTLMIDFKHTDGSLERIYLVSFQEGVYPVIQFSMSFPEGLPVSNGQWCENLPLPAQASIKTSMFFQERNLKYGAFTSYRSKASIEEELSAILENNQWSQLTNCIFINQEKEKMIVFSVSEPDENGVVSGFIIEKPVNLKK
jgi:hypothetical protein